MNNDPYRKWRMAGGVLCLLAAGSFFLLPEAKTPRAIQILNGVGWALVGVLLVVWRTSTPEWLVRLLLLGGFAGVYSGDVYETIQGQRHWSWLIPLTVLFLIAIFRKRRDNTNA